MMYLSKVVKAGQQTSVVGRQGFYTQQVEYDEAVDNCIMAFPYGYHANLTNDSLVVTMGVKGDAGNRIGFGWTPLIRPDLKPGEVAIYSPDNLSQLIKFRREPGVEDVQIVAPGTVLQFANRIQGFAGGIDYTSLTTITFDANEDIIITPGGSNKVIVQGDMQVNGDIGCTGTITGDVDVLGGTKSLLNHTHFGSPTAPVGGVSPTGAPI